MAERSSYSQSSTSMEQVLLSPNLYTIKEEAKKCCKFTYQPRHFKNKGATLLLVVNVFVVTIVNSLYLDPKLEYFFLLVFLTMPIAGWLSDVYFGRYKVTYWSVWIMWIASILSAVSSTIAQLVSSYDNSRASRVITLVILAFQVIGLGAYEANVLQFGLDQLYDAATNEIISFISWCICSTIGGYVIGVYAFNNYFSCVYCNENTNLLGQFCICVCLTVALTLFSLFHSVLVKEGVTQNPYKLVYRVINYAIKNKQPRCRSAFTYCEDELPSRMDFGKNKYGGPFTTEQVEDVKTFLRLLVVTSIVSIIIGETFAMFKIQHKLFDLLFPKSNSPSETCLYNIIYYIPPVSGVILITFHEFIFYPLLRRYLSWVTSRRKFMIGIALQLARIITLMILESKLQGAYLKQNGHNATLQCIFLEQQSDLSSLSGVYYIRWLLLPYLFGLLSSLMLVQGGVEFICAQSPHLMRGLLFGAAYGCTVIFAAVVYAIQFPFSRNLPIYESGMISCGFWYFLTVLLIALIYSVIFFIFMKLYKNRKREDVLPNEHIFAEQYYSKH